MTLPQAAEWYVLHGFDVLALKPGTKDPHTKHGKDDATSDVEQIREHWAKHPDDNIGLRPEPNELVIDVDTEAAHGANGYATLASMVDELGPLPHDADTAKTPTGGQHIWLQYPGGEHNGGLGPGIQIKGHGGYVVGPPSVIDGKRYRWEQLTTCPLKTALPDQWLAEVIKTPPPPRPKVKWNKTFDAGNDKFVATGIEENLQRLANTVRGGVPPGERNVGKLEGRNTWLNVYGLRCARLLLRIEATPGVKRDRLADQLIDACHANGLVNEHGIGSVRRTIASAFKKADAEGPADKNDRKVKDDNMTDGKGSGKNRQSSSNTNESDKSNHTITWRTADQVSDGVPEWVWYHDNKGRLMRGTLVHFAGRPEAGKSTAARYFAAGYSLGTVEGCFYSQPQHVAYIAAEESIEYWIKPSLRAYDADLSRIHFPTVQFDGQKVPLLSTRDEDLLTKHLLRIGITIVYVDPIMSTISKAADVNKSNQIRAYLEPWQRIAEAINGLVTGIVHLIKIPGLDIVASINGSSAFGEVPRAVIAFAADEVTGEHVLSQEKNSAGVKDLALTYDIEGATVHTDGGPGEVARFILGGPSERRVSDLLSHDLDRLGERSIEVLEAFRMAGEPLDLTMVSTLLPSFSRDDLGRYIRRLAKNNLLAKVGRGVFVWPLYAKNA
jgi:hypothetical protein